MKSDPNLTWEYIITVCERSIHYEREEINLNPASIMHQSGLAAWEGLLAVVTKLREHREIETMVPVMRLSYLYWFPNENHEVDLHYDNIKAEYIISVGMRTATEGVSIDIRKAVALDQVADKVYAFITKLCDD